MLWPDSVFQCGVNKHHWVQEPGEVGKAVGEIGLYHQHPEGIGQDVGVEQHAVGHIFDVLFDDVVPPHGNGCETVENEVNAESYLVMGISGIRHEII